MDLVAHIVSLHHLNVFAEAKLLVVTDHQQYVRGIPDLVHFFVVQLYVFFGPDQLTPNLKYRHHHENGLVFLSFGSV